tara:strand:- start:44073 stop:45635 length:1563 start_codon:yes stop_codon:yes gene_type:complete
MNEKIVKHLNFGEDAKNKIFEGIDKLTKAVSSTLGAGGQCVILEDSHGNPQITKDGVTVANDIILLDPVENMGSKLLKEAARKTVKEAGDGTTTATVLARAILKEAQSAESENPRELKEGINNAVEKVVTYLNKISKPVSGDRIQQVATISANNDKELGNIIGSAFKAVDETGIVSMEVNDQPETVVENIEGIQYEKGFSSPHFITNKSLNTAELDSPLVLIVENKIDNIRKLQSTLEWIMSKESGQPSLLLIADVDLQVKQALAMNTLKGNFKLNLIEPPIFGVNRKDILDDLCLLTGATLINEDLGDDMDLIQPEHFGKCKKSVSTAVETLIQVDEIPEEVNEVINSIKEKLESTSNPNFKIRYEKRLARLLAKMAIVKIGANSEVELKEKQDRVEDAICATKAAIKEGIVPGGGVALLNAANNIKAKSKGEQVLLNAICAPYSTILKNAGIEEISMPEVNGRGLDVVTGKAVNMVKAGIIDPLLVTKSALLNAASVATTILSTNCVINNLRVNEGNR